MKNEQNTRSIYHRKDGRWEARYASGRDRGGRIRYRSVYGKTRAEAEEKYLAAAAGMMTETGRNPCVAELLADCRKRTQLKGKPATVDRYRFLAEKHINPALGLIRIADLTSADVNSYLYREYTSGRLDGQGGLSAAYVGSIARLILLMGRYSVNELHVQPFLSAVEVPGRRKRLPPVLAPEERSGLDTILFSETDGTGLGILLAGYAGLRLGEVCALRWMDVDLEKGMLTVRHSLSLVHTDADGGKKTAYILSEVKTAGSYRKVPIVSRLMPVLKKLQCRDGQAFVTTGTRKYMIPRTMQNRFHAALKTAGLRQINFHALRHTFATRCIEAHTDPKSLSLALGHAKTSFTLDTYVHPDDETLRREIGKIC